MANPASQPLHITSPGVILAGLRAVIPPGRREAYRERCCLGVWARTLAMWMGVVCRKCSVGIGVSGDPDGRLDWSLQRGAPRKAGN